MYVNQWLIDHSPDCLQQHIAEFRAFGDIDVEIQETWFYGIRFHSLNLRYLFNKEIKVKHKILYLKVSIFSSWAFIILLHHKSVLHNIIREY